MRPGDRIGSFEIVGGRVEGPLQVMRARDPEGGKHRILVSGTVDLAAWVAAEPTGLAGSARPIDTPAGRGIIVDEPTIDLSRLRGPYAPATVAAIGRHLAPDLLRVAGGLPAGSPRAADFALDERGRPFFAPAPEPPDSTRPQVMAPELSPGTSNTPEGALFALGVLLHTWAVGSPPIRGALSPRVGPLGPALAALLHPDPSRRREGLDRLDDLAGPLPDLRLLVAADPVRGSQTVPGATAGLGPAGSASPVTAASSTTVGEVALTTVAGRAPVRARRDDGDRSFALVPASAAPTLSPADLSALAGELGVPIEALNLLIERGRPIPLHDGDRTTAAREVARTSKLPAQVVRPGGGLVMAAGGLGALIGIALAGLAALAGFGLLAALGPSGVVGLVAIAAGLLATIFIVGGAAAFAMGRAAATAHRNASAAAQEIDRARHLLDDPVKGAAHRAAVDARRALALAALPGPAERDLRASIDALDQLLPDARADQMPEIADGLQALTATIEELASQQGAAIATSVDDALAAASRAVGALTERAVSPDELRRRAAARAAQQERR